MGDYDDIINLPHYEPKRHPRMSMMARAAQFAPFAAVAGHDAAIREEGRVTDEWTDIGESESKELDNKMALLITRETENPMVTIEYFLPDSRKSGGTHQTISGNVRRIDDYERIIELADDRKIPIAVIKDIEIH
ncbi:MAG: hypothetical protein K6B13_04395 [Prevotella sp.]|nr:hypothetical protein [Prevotella sp.]